MATRFIQIPETGIGDLSDGYHTFNELYHQRLVLFATIVNQNPGIAWKSHRHEDGELCFGGGWFIVGITTPEGEYTYHYEDKDWDLFKCRELERSKPWDGHTDKDVTRLLSLEEVARSRLMAHYRQGRSDEADARDGNLMQAFTADAVRRIDPRNDEVRIRLISDTDCPAD